MGDLVGALPLSRENKHPNQIHLTPPFPNRLLFYSPIFDTVDELNQTEALHESDKAMRRYLRPGLLIIDDMGLKKLPKQSGEYLFEEKNENDKKSAKN